MWWPPSITVAGNRWKTVGYLRVSEVSGAQGENRTLTPLLAGDFESPASTVPPLGHCVACGPLQIYPSQ